MEEENKNSLVDIVVSIGAWRTRGWFSFVNGEEEVDVELFYGTVGGSFVPADGLVFISNDRSSKTNRGRPSNTSFFRGSVKGDGCLKFVLRRAQDDQVLGIAHMLVREKEMGGREEKVPLVCEKGQFLGYMVVYLLVGDRPLFPNLAGEPHFKCTDMKGVHIGHRGFGSTVRRLGVAENTLTAFKVAEGQGVYWVEFDVQLTKDAIPVLLHDYEVLVSGTVKTPIDSLTLEELNNMMLRPPGLTKTARGLGPKSASAQSFETQDLIAAHFSVHDKYPTLKEVFRHVPDSVGFNLEMKFGESKSRLRHKTDRNTYVNRILQVVNDHAKSRKVVFSSFDPDVCYLASMKQSKYPVMFLTETGKYNMDDYRRDSLKAAIWWCKSNNFAGIVAEIKRAKPHFQLLEDFLKDGYAVFTFGALNSDKETFLMQRDKGVNGIICDNHRVSK